MSHSLLSFVFLFLLVVSLFFQSTSSSIAKPNCESKCGNITIPYPFGIGLGSACSITSWFDVNCDSSFDPPKPFLSKTNSEIVDVSNNELRVKNKVASPCFDKLGKKTNGRESVWFDLGSTSPFSFSDKNKFTVLGTGCISACSSIDDLADGDCTDVGCCQTGVPKGLKSFNATLIPLTDRAEIWSFAPRGYAFLGDSSGYGFRVADLKDPGFGNRIVENVPVVLEWGVGEKSCQGARESGGFACHGNSECVDFDVGHQCWCRQGFEGNPYLSPGCTGALKLVSF